MNHYRPRERGSATLMGSLFVMGVVALYLHGLVKILETDKKIRERKRAYLCFKYQVILMKGYVRQVGRLNGALRTSFLLSLNPKTAVMAKTVHKTALALQKGIHLKYTLERIRNNYCGKKEILPFILAPPYREAGVSLVRNVDGTSQVRRSKWEIFYWHNGIVLSAAFGPLGVWGQNLKVTTSEVL